MAESGSDGQCNTKPTSSDPDLTRKPFKKAKYEWQIKGRGRDLTPPFNTNPTSSKPKSDITEIHIDEPETPPNEIPENSEISIPENSTSSIPETPSSPPLPHQPPVAQAFHQTPVFFPSDVAAQCVDEFFSTLNRNNYSLRKWQTKQIAKAIIDNAINKVLEDMGFTPLPSDAFDFHLIDASSSPPDNDLTPQNIESKGVSEAIRQQGLHRRTQDWSDVQQQQQQQQCPPNNTTCTCLLHWRSTCESHGRDDDVSVERESCSLPEQENVLDAALSFAISEKGLGSFSR